MIKINYFLSHADKKRQLGIKVWTSSFFKGIFFFENLKRIASVISNDPPCLKIAMTDSQRWPENLCLFKYQIDINVFKFAN